MVDEQARMQILEMIESGKISASQGLQLLEALRKNDAAGEAPLLPDDLQEEAGAQPGADRIAIPLNEPGGNGAQAFPSASSFDSDETIPEPEVLGRPHQDREIPNMRRWKRWWMLPFWFGVAWTVLGGLFMYFALEARGGISFWFVLASLPFIVGLVITVLSWQARSARWLHLRITQKEGSSPRNIAFSFPLPLRLSAWAVRTFGGSHAEMKGVKINEVITALEHSANPDNPLYIEVNDEEDGEHVEIFIG